MSQKPSGDVKIRTAIDTLLTGIGSEFDEELHLSGDQARSIAALITTLERQLATAREALRDLLRGEYESAEPGLCDCVDNHGKPYQSQFLADRIAMAEAALTPGVSDAE